MIKTFIVELDTSLGKYDLWDYLKNCGFIVISVKGG